MSFLSILKLMEIVGQLMSDGKLTIGRFRAFLAQAGATPEQLTDLDARLTAEINERL